MHPVIEKLYNDTIIDGKLNATLFADKIMLHCRGIAATHIMSTSPQDFDDMDTEYQIEERTAVQICGGITSYLSRVPNLIDHIDGLIVDAK
jgi:hypothetical protein